MPLPPPVESTIAKGDETRPSGVKQERTNSFIVDGVREARGNGYFWKAVVLLSKLATPLYASTVAGYPPSLTIHFSDGLVLGL